jgi:hypothetical protein
VRRRRAADQAADGGHGDVGDHDGADGGAGFHLLAHIAAAAGLAGRPVDDHPLAVEADIADRAATASSQRSPVNASTMATSPRPGLK